MAVDLYGALYSDVLNADEVVGHEYIARSVSIQEARRILGLAKWQPRVIDMLFKGSPIEKPFAVGKILLSVVS